MAEMVTVKVDDLHAFTAQVFEKYGVPAEDAKTTADVLVAADRRDLDATSSTCRTESYIRSRISGLSERPR
jgi:LDH2 family malate/lactate/ureidoglycolate dehydrogenase